MLTINAHSLIVSFIIGRIEDNNLDMYYRLNLKNMNEWQEVLAKTVIEKGGKSILSHHDLSLIRGLYQGLNNEIILEILSQYCSR